jgi:hypothetical protein
MRHRHAAPALAIVVFAACGEPAPGPLDAAAEAAVAPGILHATGREHDAHDAHGATLTLVADHASRTLVLDLGPVLLPPAPPGGQAMAGTPLLSTRLPADLWLTGFEVELLDAAGRRLSQRLLHHVNVMLPDSRELFRPIMQRLVAAGAETGPISLPWPLGFRVRAGQELLAYAMLHNEGPADYGNVTLRMKLSHGRGPRLSVQPFFIDASPPPGPAAWDLPPGRSERSW